LSAVRSLEPWRWLGVPMVQAMGVTVLFSIPLRVWGLQLPEPVFPMAAVFAWGVIRPSVLAPLAAVIMGLFLDIFWGGAIGLWALILLIAYGLVLGARSMTAGQSRGAMWVWYAVVTAIAMGAGFLIVALRDKAMPSLIATGWQYLATIVLYPFAYRLIDMFEDADVRFR
jgi:rod shape-determining protein MreD